ncbi:adenosylmethionine--8-amino-7-oxononanoate transaminase [Candidatus Thiothrix sp. Deng01]|uniref:Adenosylmethionine-8-amino-7-oxononanoate aminotransferase n=1 Tax=Candidatus Thiothrix phosphatis TaxID=3112415 RepID=A0ABU6D155_9GAMM|nr:adenosylmethionine--8-amino-7-oxononanoate transaminase [Candidatus Thiothrix sp. Deng01]MEB4592760.1 adenosylmethionine--8-amino-7-oxononanoate transaminase [Candidatus Thiothrix sp. Deng01]
MDTSIIQQDRQHVWHPFTQEQTAPDPIEITSASGIRLHTADGREFLDLVSSWWVNIHGHAHPAIAQAIAQQAQTLEQVIFAGFTHRPAVQLASGLVKRLPEGLSRVFFSDDGSTAVEVALKMALQYWRNQGETQRSRFLAFEGGYHGDTVGAMSVGQGSAFFDTYGSLLFEVGLLPYPATWEGDAEVEAKEQAALARLDEYLRGYGETLAGVIIEPLVQGASGMHMCRPEFLQQLAAKLQAAGILLIFDEVMTGFGRTGKLFASLKAEVTPDIICLSKGITAGFLPLSVTVTREAIYAAFLGENFDRALVHGHSFTANPLGCAAGVASLQVFDSENTLAKLPQIEAWHWEELLTLATHPLVRRVRVTGTIAAFNVETADAGYSSSVGPRLKQFFHERGLLLRPLGNVLYLLPPYCITEDELRHAYAVIRIALDDLAAG